jgi:phosphohistidine phosphatase
MIIYLAQHGLAVDKKINPDRPLSDQGRLEVKNAANYLKQSDVAIKDIYHSGKTRADQTASIFADVLNIEHIEKLDGINPNDEPEPIVDLINNWTDDTMLVTHLPFLPHLVHLLLTGKPPSDSDYLPGNIICLEKDDSGEWLLAGSSNYASFS